MRKRVLIIIIIILAVVGAFGYRHKIKSFFINLQKADLPQAVDWQPNETSTESQLSDNQNSEDPATTPPEAVETDPITDPESETLPAEYNLAVPFTSQAPYADWTEPFKEACEEASIMMVDHFYKKTPFTKDTATQEITASVDWQNENWGGHYDLTVVQTIDLIKNYFGYDNVRVLDNPTLEQIKKELISGRPIIVPAAGRLLGNPNFRAPGPIYHMLVIKGYTKNQFITNDPGTRLGADYLYDFDVIFNANHDWLEADVNAGAKKMIVIMK